MNINLFLIIFSVFNLLTALYGFYKCRYKAHTYSTTGWLYPLGIFVWGDALVIGLFWALAGFVSLFLQDWLLFLLIFSVFWLVRSAGETIYWLIQQFTDVNQYPPENLFGHKLFPGRSNKEYDAILFVNQIFMQTITVITIITTIYLTHLWLQSL